MLNKYEWRLEIHVNSRKLMEWVDVDTTEHGDMYEHNVIEWVENLRIYKLRKTILLNW